MLWLALAARYSVAGLVREQIQHIVNHRVFVSRRVPDQQIDGHHPPVLMPIPVVFVAPLFGCTLLRGVQQLQQRRADPVAQLRRIADASWYQPNAVLTVVARTDVLANIELPPGTGQQNLRQTEYGYDIDWEETLVARLAVENLRRKRHLQDARESESKGDYQGALLLYSDIAYADRTGRFGSQAKQALREARRIYREHPELNVHFVHFHQRQDRDSVIGPVAPIMKKQEMRAALKSIDRPANWGTITIRKHGSADCHIGVNETDPPWGWATFEQGGNRNLWGVRVECKDLENISSVADGNPRSLWIPENYCLPSLEAAVNEAVRYWQEFDKLLQKTTAESNIPTTAKQTARSDKYTPGRRRHRLTPISRRPLLYRRPARRYQPDHTLSDDGSRMAATGVDADQPAANSAATRRAAGRTNSVDYCRKPAGTPSSSARTTS